MKQFKTESKKLLDLMINSIYTNREIFLRELISNASDAIDKLAFMALTDPTIDLGSEELGIRLSFDKDERTITVSDNGVGMTQDELDKNLGTIAHSGSEAFKLANAEHQGQDIDIIGQFGVGFYSSFMVASKVRVVSRAYGSDQAFAWTSDGVRGYSIAPAAPGERDGENDHGTDVTLYLREAEGDDSPDKYLSEWGLRDLVRRYSNYVRHPVQMMVTKSRELPKPEDAGDDYTPQYESYQELETLNSMTPIWKRRSSDVEQDDYDEFYTSTFHDWEKPARTISFHAEGALSYDALLFIPSRAPFDLYSKDYEKGLNEKTAHEVWTLTEKMLKEDNMGVRGIIKKSNVQFIGTTDDPTDNLEWHRKLMEDGSFETIVAPSFRPDKALGIDKNGWREYICTLSEVCGIKIDSIKTLEQALLQRIDFFNESGCKASDHGLDHMVYAEASAEELEEIMSKALGGEAVTALEAECFKTHFLLLCARKYAQIGWAMQLHYNCMRNPNRKMFSLLGPDTGFDCIGPDNGSNKLALLLNRLFEEGSLPKTIIYSLDASDNSFIDSLIGSYQGTEIAGKLQHGSAWWFNDNLQGMKEQLISLANLSILGNFIGMLTDSRSFLSYTRHEYFRRILCELLGQWVENGEYPADFDTLGMIVKGICHDNAQTYFNITAK